MSSFLANLLSQDKNVFGKYISTLENSSGNLQFDVKLTSEIKLRTTYKIRALGLDPSNVTANELYYSLRNLVGVHDRFINKKLSIENHQDQMTTLNRIINFSIKSAGSNQCYAVKLTSLNKIFKNNPPKYLVKILGYRAYESMIKRQNSYMLLAACKMTENEEWHREFINQISKLNSTDFELRKLNISLVNDQKYEPIVKNYIGKKKTNVLVIPEIGRTFVLPLKQSKLEGFTILTFAQIIDSLKQILTFSVYASYHKFSSDFGALQSEYILNKDKEIFSISKYKINWQSVINLLIRRDQKNINLDDTFSSDSDLSLFNADGIDKMIYQIEPALHFWFESDYLGLVINSKTVSFNLLDCSYNFVNHLDLKDSSSKYLRTAVESKIISSYSAQSLLEKQVLDQLEDGNLNNRWSIIADRALLE